MECCTIPFYMRFNFYNRPQEVIHPPRIPSKNEYQRVLHESYQLLVKLINEQQGLEEEQRKAEQEDKKKKNKKEDTKISITIRDQLIKRKNEIKFKALK